MITIVITKDGLSTDFWRVLLSNNDFKFLIFNEDDYETLQVQAGLLNQPFAVILDKAIVDVSFFEKISFSVDLFIILDRWKDSSIYKSANCNCNVKFYKTPINTSILLDDLKSVTRIREYLDVGQIKLGNLTLNLNTRTLENEKTAVFLRNREYDLLLFLVKNHGKVVSRATLLEQVWDMNSKIMTNTVDVHISKLRKILRCEFGVSSLIKTIPCCGYILT